MRKMRKDIGLRLSLLLGVPAVSVILDRITKAAVIKSLYNKSVTVIDGALNFTYLENRGAAFGMLSDSRWVFMLLSVLLIAAIFIYGLTTKETNVMTLVSLSLIAGGGVGNMIDRFMYGYVVDFIDVRLFSFWKWIFNVADMFVCVGAALLLLSFIIDGITTKKAHEKN